MKINVQIDTEENYVIVNGVEVACSREVYLTTKRDIRRDAMRKYRNQRPFINGERCKGECERCTCFEGGKCDLSFQMSLDRMNEEAAVEAVASDNVEQEACNNILLQEMRDALSDEDEVVRDIFDRLALEMTQREIASDLGIAQGTVTYYIKKMRKKLERFR